MSNIYLQLRRHDVLKTSVFPERKFEEMHQLWRAKRYKLYSGNVYFVIIIFSCLSPTTQGLTGLLICFARQIKGFYQRSLGNEVDFKDIMNISSNIMAKNKYFKKLRHGFVQARAMISATLKSSCHWKTIIVIAKEKTWKNIFSTNSELLHNRTEKEIVIQDNSKLAI